LGTTLLATFLTRSHMGVTQEDKASPWPPGALGISGPRISPWSQPPSPPRRLQKVDPREAGPSRHSLTCRVSKQSSRTMPKASLAPRHYHSPQRVAARPSWTPAHVDHRLVPPNRYVPDLSRYIWDKVRPWRGEETQITRRHSIPFLGLCSAPRPRQPMEGHRELLHCISSSSFSPTR
jgi:hypothetical protein